MIRDDKNLNLLSTLLWLHNHFALQRLGIPNWASPIGHPGFLAIAPLLPSFKAHFGELFYCPRHFHKNFLSNFPLEVAMRDPIFFIEREGIAHIVSFIFCPK
ncbi:hypothetical protein H4F05_13005 [Vibrio cholerae]